MTTPTTIDVYAARARAELLRRKFSVKQVKEGEFDLGLGNYYLIRVGIVEEDLEIKVDEFVDLLETSLKKYLDDLHEKEQELSEITMQLPPRPEPPSQRGQPARVEEDVDIKPRTIRDQIYREFLHARAEKLKEVRTS